MKPVAESIREGSGQEIEKIHRFLQELDGNLHSQDLQCCAFKINSAL